MALGFTAAEFVTAYFLIGNGEHYVGFLVGSASALYAAKKSL